MSTAPRLTVGLPVYNGENYLAQSLEALLGQTYTDFELLISDNTSTDDTASICAQYQAADPRIRYIRQPRNIGCAPNHNFVVGEARGESLSDASMLSTSTRTSCLRTPSRRLLMARGPSQRRSSTP
jgi:glycosyltransferase involved in cell wall biosynthesis